RLADRSGVTDITSCPRSDRRHVRDHLRGGRRHRRFDCSSRGTAARLDPGFGNRIARVFCLRITVHVDRSSDAPRDRGVEVASAPVYLHADTGLRRGVHRGADFL
ncbi:uncharacterized protein METZ01_LOCUS223125, partial [marine metagenome]